MIIPLCPAGVITFPVAAATTSGTTGDCTWTLDGTVLTISGNGAMGDYTGSSAPWGTSITEVVIENGVESIGFGAFYCTGITSITIPNSVTSIDKLSFYNCIFLSSVTIGKGVARIGEVVFGDCSSLVSLVIPNTEITIEDYAFEGCTVLSSVYYRGSESEKGNISIGVNNSSLTSAAWYYNSCLENAPIYTHIYTDDHDHDCNECGHIRFVIGDADGDGELSDWDGIVLARYLAGWDVENSNLGALDLDSDGEITDWDGVLLNRTLAGWSL